MHVIYKITYLPHLITQTPPYYYIGSKFNYDGKYMGSPASNQMDWYTEEMSIKNWWKTQIFDKPKDFLFEVLEVVNTDSPQFLVEIEKDYHIKLDVRHSVDYFNKSIATSGWVSSPRTDLTKELASKKTSEYWNSPDGEEKKKRLSERNRATHSEKMKSRWTNPTDSMKNAIHNGRPKGAKDLVPRNPKPERSVYVEGIIYESAKLASDTLNIHPATVRRKCKSTTILEWRYIE